VLKPPSPAVTARAEDGARSEMCAITRGKMVV